MKRLTGRLARIEAKEAERFPEHLYLAGHDLGRHVVAKRVPSDDLEATLETLQTALAETTWARLSVRETFLRTAHVTLEAGEAELPDRVRDPFVAGVIDGTITEALNTRPALVPEEGGLRIELGDGPGAQPDEVEG